MALALSNITNVLFEPDRKATPRSKQQGGKATQHAGTPLATPPAVPVAAAAAIAATPAASQLSAQQEAEELHLIRVFRNLAFETDDEQSQAATATPAAEAITLAANSSSVRDEDSFASSSASSLADTSPRSQLDSPLAAFAAAKARLVASNSKADSRIESTLHHLQTKSEQAASQAASAVSEAAAAVDTPENSVEAATRDVAGSSCSQLQRHPLPQECANASTSASSMQLQPAASSISSMATSSPLVGSPLPALTVLKKRNVLLKERLSSTLQLCQSLHEQNHHNMEKVTQLWVDNQRLNRSLQEAQADKQLLRDNIRQLTHEAALLARQAREALMAGELKRQQRREQRRQQKAQEQAEAAAQAQAEAGEGPLGQQVLVGDTTAACSAASAPAAPAARAPLAAVQLGQTLVRDWPTGGLSASSSGSEGSRQGAAWQPSLQVHCFDCNASSMAATYVHRSADGESASDKRQRLAPGMLACCLQPVIAAAVAEAANMAAAAGIGSSNGSVRSLGRTPKRKHRHLDSSSAATGLDLGTPLGMGLAGSRGALSPASAQQKPTSLAIPAAAVAAEDPTDDGLMMFPPLAALSPLGLQSGSIASGDDGDREEEECGAQRFHTFDLLEERWYGSVSLPASPAQSLVRSSAAGSTRSSCRVM